MQGIDVVAEILEQKSRLMFTHQYVPRNIRNDHEACLIAFSNTLNGTPVYGRYLSIEASDFIVAACKEHPAYRRYKDVHNNNLPWAMNDAGEFTRDEAIGILDRAAVLAKEHSDNL